jgi:hypothetical protein
MKPPSTMTLIAFTIAPVVGHIQSATGALHIDIRATGVSGGGTLVSPKQVNNVVPGSVVAFDIFAVVVGTNASTSDDKFISVAGSWRSSSGGIMGNLAADLVPTDFKPPGNDPPILGFDGLGSSVGLQQDLDGDGDLDVGSNNDSHANDFWAARYAGAPFAISAGSLSPTSGGRRIGFGTFTVTAGSGFATVVNFDGRAASTAANYIQDGQPIQGESMNGLVPLVIVNPPEPTSLGLVVLGAFSLMHRPRRFGMRGTLARI